MSIRKASLRGDYLLDEYRIYCIFILRFILIILVSPSFWLRNDHIFDILKSYFFELPLQLSSKCVEFYWRRCHQARVSNCGLSQYDQYLLQPIGYDIFTSPGFYMSKYDLTCCPACLFREKHFPPDSINFVNKLSRLTPVTFSYDKTIYKHVNIELL
jgi:hypothetical protein